MHIFIFIILSIIIYNVFEIKNSLNELKLKLLKENLSNENIELKNLSFENLLKELAVIVQDIKCSVDIGIPIWKKEYPYYKEYNKSIIQLSNGWFNYLVTKSKNYSIQLALFSINETLKENKEITFTFKKNNDCDKINYLIMNYSFMSFLSIEEKVESDDEQNWNKFEGLCGTDLTIYTITLYDASRDLDYDGEREILILEKNFIKKLYDYGKSKKHIECNVDEN